MINDRKVRRVTAEQLGLFIPTPPAAEPPVSAASDEAALDDNDRVLVAVKDALADGYAGIILSGVPGTGKSRHASLVARALTDGQTERSSFVQFHPSYQYEDFIEGYVPSAEGFTRQLKSFSQLCIDASEDAANQYIMVIDEISRADVARVFGEALTYIERSKRNRAFKLASGTDLVVPENLFIIATMNPWDRGVDELDAALERRFAFVEMLPEEGALRELLALNGLPETQIERVTQFFTFLQELPNTRCHLGHGYFTHARDADSLARLWALQLAHVLRRACHDDDLAFGRIAQRWSDVVKSFPPDSPDRT